MKSWFCLVLINSILLNLSCVWISLMEEGCLKLMQFGVISKLDDKRLLMSQITVVHEIVKEAVVYKISESVSE